MPISSDMLIFWAVVIARFLVPLAIPKYPLPGIIASLFLDAIDQTIFQQFTDLPLAGYQAYDKALDIYYLAITYLSTLRNWSNLYAFRIGQFLFYYRLIGVALFEITEFRPLLLFFPNTFEYFFIFYEIIRLKWNPNVLTENKLIIITALIWVFVKLPQEYWIHIAKMDTTDWISANPVNAVYLIGWFGILCIMGWALIRDFPPAHPGLSVAADYKEFPFDCSQAKKIRDNYTSKEFFDDFIHHELIEKIVLVSLLSIIFAQILPGVRASTLQVAAGIIVLIVINTEMSQWFARHGNHWKSILKEFIVMCLVNFGIVLVFDFVIVFYGGYINALHTLFFILLLTLNVTLYDRFQRAHIWTCTLKIDPEKLEISEK